MPVKQTDLESSLLKILLSAPLKVQALSNVDALSFMGADAMRTVGSDLEATQKALWNLVSRGLVWIRVTSHATGLWDFNLTDRGRTVASGDDPNPDDPTEYLARILRNAPKTSETVKMYLSEALNSYVHRSYLSSMVMLGVASEACTLETASLYIPWAGARGEKFKEIFEGKHFYVRKLNEFHKRLEAEKDKLPDNIKNALNLDVLSLLEIIRLTRNDAGHPTGVTFERDDCNSRLQFYAAVHKRLHQLQDFFVAGTK